MAEPGRIQLEQFIARSPAAVWQALTSADLIARWWAPGDIRPQVGHRFTLDMGAWGQQPCEILTAEPERLLVYSFAAGMLNTTVSWRLQAEGEGTRLYFEQAGFDLGSQLGQTAYQGMGAGWPGILAKIETVLPAG